MPDYSIDNLKHGIEQAKKNIETFESAIDKENENIKKFRWMIQQVERKEDENKKATEIGKHLQAQIEDRKNGD